MSVCAYCKEKPCQDGPVESSLKGCPTLNTNAENEIGRYTEQERQLAKAAAKVEAGGYGVLCRIEEIMEFAIQNEFTHLGIAFCAGFSEESLIFEKVLRSNGFSVDTVCCKNGAVSKEEIGIGCEYFVDAGAQNEVMCNPAGQADVLDQAGCQLNIIMGLCVGHDSLFIKHSKAPVTVLATVIIKTLTNER